MVQDTGKSMKNCDYDSPNDEFKNFKSPTVRGPASLFKHAQRTAVNMVAFEENIIIEVGRILGRLTLIFLLFDIGQKFLNAQWAGLYSASATLLLVLALLLWRKKRSLLERKANRSSSQIAKCENNDFSSRTGQ